MVSELPHIREKAPFRNSIAIEAYGAKINIHTTSSDALPFILDSLAETFPDGFHERICSEGSPNFYYAWNKNKRDSLYDDAECLTKHNNRVLVLDKLAGRVRLRVAEHATDHVFVHAGVVNWKGWGIVIPGESFTGKTSLVVELIKLGADYYSDEFAVFDRDGKILPFTKKLSVRGESDAFVQVSRRAEEFGAKKGRSTLKTALVVSSRFVPLAQWHPLQLSPAEGVMELIKNTVSIRRNPNFCIETLCKVATDTCFIASLRGEAAPAAVAILDYVEKNCDSYTDRSK